MGKHVVQAEHPKRPRVNLAEKPGIKYESGSQIKAAFGSENPDTLTQVLTSIRSQLTVKSHEVSVSPQDARLTIVKEWMGISPGAGDLFEIWNKAHPRQSSMLALVLSNLAAILTLLSAHYTEHASGRPIMKALLTPSSLRYLNSYIGGSHNELILTSLKLYNVMSNFAGGQDKKSVLDGFGWEIKGLPNLLKMRRRVRGAQDRSDPILRPDIRTLFILFLFSFLDINAATQTKYSLLEQHRDVFLAVFKGIAQDHYSLARKVLESCWSGIWSDSKLSRTVKVGLFNETTICHLTKLYERIQSDNEEDEEIPADLVHHFLLAICTRPGTGVCFKDRGWYPREPAEDDVVTRDDERPKKRTGGRLHNKILANVLKTLRVNEDTRQQELATRILEACPELIAGYWSPSLTLEPRLSTKWITNIAFFGNIVSLPPPAASFYLANQLFNPTPPPLSTVLENILPSTSIKTNLSKGLQSSSGLVQHCTAIALTKCLLKFQQVLEQFRTIAKALEEEGEEGQWSTRCTEIEREVRRRVPDFMVVIAFGHQTQQLQADTGDPPKSGPTQQLQNNPMVRAAFLGESAQRLLWLYQKCLPGVVAEARFDVGKMLQSFRFVENRHDERDPDAVERIYRVQMLHVLRLLKDSEQFAWTTKIPTLSRTPFFVLLGAYISSTTLAIRTALGDLICHLLSQSPLFQEDPDEPDLWLKALPSHRPSFPPDLQNHDLDAIDLQDEETGVITFLDECVQRCLRTLYRYVEIQRSMPSAPTAGFGHLGEYPSPLIMTLFEQLEVKITNKSLTPSHVIGISAFLGKLIFYLASKMKDLFILRVYADKLGSILSSDRDDDRGLVVIAVAREVKILQEILGFTVRSRSESMDDSVDMEPWIAKVEGQSISGTKLSRRALALCIVDKVRTLQEPLTTDSLKRLVELINSLDNSILPRFIEYLAPGQADLWSSFKADILRRPHDLTFERLYVHASEHDLADLEKQTILAKTIFTSRTRLVELKRAVLLVMHGIRASADNQTLLKAHILILTQIFGRSKAIFSEGDFEILKDLVFVHPNCLKDMFLLPLTANILDAVDGFLASCINRHSTTDRKLLWDTSTHWLNLIKPGQQRAVQDTVSNACIWIKYLEPTQLLELLYSLLEPEGGPQRTPAQLPEVILKTLLSYASSIERQNELLFATHLPRLLSLSSVLPNSLLDQVIASTVESSMPMGLDGLWSSSTGNLATLVDRCKIRWRENLRAVRGGTDVDLHQIFKRGQLSDSTSRLVRGLLYQRPSTFSSIAQWVKSAKYSRTDDIQDILRILHGLIDVSRIQGQKIDDDIWVPFLPQIAGCVADRTASTELRLLSQHCLRDLILACGARKSDILDVLAKAVETMVLAPTLEFIDLAIWLGGLHGSTADHLLSLVVDRGMQWSVDQITGGNKEPDFESFLRSLGSLVQMVSVPKAPLVETLVTVIIQYRLPSGPALQLAVACASCCPLKPVVVNRLLQNIIQHPHFAKHCSVQPLDGGCRDALIELLHVLFNLHPNNTCQITHVEPLIDIYHGTLSNSDLRTLSILQLFERQRKLSVAPLLSLWSATPDATSASALEALQSLDPGTVFKTCLNFPRWRRLGRQESVDSHSQDSKLYDPVFLLLLFSNMVAEQTPSSTFAWIDLLRTNVVSLFLRALSAMDVQIRELALCQVVALWRKLENADFQEKLQVLYILNLVRRLIPAPSSPRDVVRRLPTYTTLLLSHALRAIFYPASFLYPLTARFLLQRPTLDISDVPMLYGMLYSSSDENWKKERAWMIKFLADGMVGSEDWRVLKRRHTWDLLASLFQNEAQTGATSLRSGILEVLANLTCNSQATTSLVLKSGLLSWIEMQLALTHHATIKMECVQWIKILENILIIVNPDKVEAATNGEWRRTISRCLCWLLDGKYASVENLAHAAPVVLRLASIENMQSTTNVIRFFELAVNSLEKLEAQIHLPTNLSGKSPISKYDFPSPPHRATTMQKNHVAINSLEAGQKLSLWGELVEILWHSSMLTDDGVDVAHALVPRILMWRSLKGGLSDEADISEWTRREVVRNLYHETPEPQQMCDLI